MTEQTTPLTAADELKVKLDLTKAFGETAKSYIQISSAALALPIIFTQAILGKDVAEKGLRVAGVPASLYAAWACFLLAILSGLIYQWASVRRVWDDLHTIQKTDTKAAKPGFRTTWWVPQFPNMNLSLFYGAMMVFFFWGAVFFVVFSASLILK